MSETKRKAPRGHGKGGVFERDISRRLSLWWTGGQYDDVFWRTAGSGGRATVRGSRRTSGQYGDIQATDSAGKLLLRFFTFELKKGYNRHTFMDLIDKPEHAAPQEWERWMVQAIESAASANSRTWALIVQRDRRQPLIFLPGDAWSSLAVCLAHPSIYPRVILYLPEIGKVVGVPLGLFLKRFTPLGVKVAWNEQE